MLCVGPDAGLRTVVWWGVDCGVSLVYNEEHEKVLILVGPYRGGLVQWQAALLRCDGGQCEQ